MVSQVALRRRLERYSIQRSVNGSLYKIDHLQRTRRFCSRSEASTVEHDLTFDFGLLLQFNVSGGAKMTIQLVKVPGLGLIL